MACAQVATRRPLGREIVLSLVDAVRAVGVIPSGDTRQSLKKRYSELLSKALADEVAVGMRSLNFPNVKPLRGQAGEKEFQGGLGPKRVDVSYSDERHGLLLAVSIKTICFQPFGKNLKNRFSDLCTEAITLHMRFPYGVICALFAMPHEADQDVTRHRTISTFRRAGLLLSSIGGRVDYASAGEKFEQITMMRFRPMRAPGDEPQVWLYAATPGTNLGVTAEELTEAQYFRRLRDVFNLRNPHAGIGLPALYEEGPG